MFFYVEICSTLRELRVLPSVCHVKSMKNSIVVPKQGYKKMSLDMFEILCVCVCVCTCSIFPVFFCRCNCHVDGSPGHMVDHGDFMLHTYMNIYSIIP